MQRTHKDTLDDHELELGFRGRRVCRPVQRSDLQQPQKQTQPTVGLPLNRFCFSKGKQTLGKSSLLYDTQRKEEWTLLEVWSGLTAHGNAQSAIRKQSTKIRELSTGIGIGCSESFTLKGGGCPLPSLSETNHRRVPANPAFEKAFKCLAGRKGIEAGSQQLPAEVDTRTVRRRKNYSSLLNRMQPMDTRKNSII